MNEQIKELVKQSGLNIDGYGNPIWGCLDTINAKKAFLVNFAKLVEKTTVEKCIEIAKKQMTINTPSYIEPNSFCTGIEYVIQSLNSNFRIGN